MKAALDIAFAAYTPAELVDLAESVSTLLDCATLPADRAARDRIDEALRQAIERRMDEERTAGQTAVVLPFPAPH